MSYRNSQTLENLYWNQGMSTHDIGKTFDVDHVTILKYMKKHEIPRRNRKEAQFLQILVSIFLR